MDFQAKILFDLANREFKRITTNTIRNMQSYRESLLSGDDSVLENVWDEICVQVQGEHSFYWDVYVDMIEKYVRFEVEKLSPEIQMALWKESENGFSWDVELDGEPENSEEDVIKHIIHEHVLFEAGRWTNDRIRYFLEQSARRD